MKCHYIYDEIAGKVLIPGCMGSAVYGMYRCTCRPLKGEKEETEQSKDKRLIKELETENARLNRIIKKIVAATNKKKPGNKAAVESTIGGPKLKHSRMADKRKADFTFLLKSYSKRKFDKIEIFSSEQWGGQSNKYRIRVNGRWYDKKADVKKYYYRTEIRDLIWRSVSF